jgi:hypothetical protein
MNLPDCEYRSEPCGFFGDFNYCFATPPWCELFCKVLLSYHLCPEEWR